MPLLLDRADAGRVRGARLGRRHRVPARARRRLHHRRRRRDASGSRSPNAASRPTAARPGCCRAESATSRARELLLLGRQLTRRPKPPRGARSTARFRRPSSTARSTSSSTLLAHGPTVALGLTKWLLHQGRERSLEQQLANEAFALELSSRTDDFREGLAAFRERRPPQLRGPVSMDTAVHARGRRRTRRRTRSSTRCARGSTRHVPRAWIDAGRAGGAAAIRAVRTRADVRGVVPGVRGVGAGRADVAGRVRRARSRARDGARSSRRSCDRSTSAGSTRSGSTWPRPRCSRTAPRSNGCASCRRSCATKRCGASCSASRAPAPTSRRSRREPSATATTGSSPARRCGPRGRTSPTSACCSRAPIPTSRSGRASRTSCSTCTSPASRCGRCGTSRGEVDFNEVFLDARRRPRRAARRRGRRRLEGRQRDAVRRAADGVGRGLGRRRPHRRPRRRPRDRARARPRPSATTRSSARSSMRVYSRGAHPRLDEPARARAR